VATVNDLVNDALTRWVALTGLVDKKGSTGVAKSCPWEPWKVRSLTESLSESRTLDPTGLTTFMLLRGLTEAYLQDIQFSAYDLILAPEAIESQLVPMRSLREFLEEPDVVQLIASFEQQIRDGAIHYGFTPGKALDDLEEFVQSRYALAGVRRDALLSMGRLEAHQFTQGSKDEQPLKYSSEIFEFWNVNSLLAAMRSQKFGGISLCLIRDPEMALRSYFVFAIRNGGTLTMLTDKSKDPHPAFKRMARRPDRDFDRRASQHWFPYQLLDLTKVGRDARTAAKLRTQLVLINVDAVPLAKLSAVPPEQFVWLMLMFDLIREKFWAQDVKLPEISYTGQMIVEPQALVGAHGALVKDGFYKPLELPPLAAADITDKVLRPQWNRKPTYFNQWMVDRYKDRVPDEVLNPVGDQAKLLLVAKSKEPGFLPMAIVGSKSPLMDRANDVENRRFETMEPTDFGTKKELVRDRLWVARMNQCAIIQELAKAEFEEEKDDVCAWYKAAIQKNRKEILDACARGEWALPIWEVPDWGSGKIQEKNALDQWMSKSSAWSHRSSSRSLFKLGETKQGGAGRPGFWVACAEQPELKASIFSNILVSCPQAIAIVCGVDVDALPWPLQHWFNQEPYNGNSILDRIDPSDWRIKNPWQRIDFSVGVAHSKTAYHARRQAMGLPRRDVSELPVER
jgi:hypothetical protein